MHKLLPLLLLLGVALFFLFTYDTPLKRDLLFFTQNDLLKDKINLTADDTTSCVSNNALTGLTGEFDQSAQVAFYDSHEVDYPQTSLAEISDEQNPQNVLAAYDAQGKEKWIEVSLTAQQLRAWEGNTIVDTYPISSGKWAATPTGTFTIYWKLRYVRMTGGDKSIGTYYDLPNVPDTMFFYEGYGLHGAYWHNNFGHPMSHGCVNEPLDKAHWLFEWAGPQITTDQQSVRSTPENPGSKVCIHFGGLVDPSKGDPEAQACQPGIHF